MIILPVYDVQQWDGGDRHKHGFYIRRESVTVPQIERAVPHSMSLTLDLIVLDNLSEIPEMEQEQLRRRALSKLTPMEKKALGLKET